MSNVIGTLHMSIDCLCNPPKRLVTNEEQQADRCDVCGTEILTGALTTGPRLRVVKNEEPDA